MKAVTYEELISMIQLQASRNIDKKDIKMVLDSFIAVVKECIKTGINVRLPLLGLFTLKEMKGYKNRKFWNYHTKQIDYADYPAHNLPVFKPSKIWAAEVKEYSWGDPR